MGKTFNCKIISCEGFDIATTIEGENIDEYPIYYPSNCLIYVECGQLKLKIENQVFTVNKNEFVFVRKYVYGKYIKIIDEGEGKFRDHIFILNDIFIKEVIREFEFPENIPHNNAPIFQFSSNPVLKGLMKSIEIYVNGQVDVDRELIQLKTKEAFYALTKLNPELITVFYEFSAPGKADLVSFMEHNFMYNISLERFAQLSGRSLSSFNREFRRFFKQTPHKWIKERRLELAKRILTQTQRMPIDVYLEVGFKDLAHFSRSFKDHFGINPSELKQNLISQN